MVESARRSGVALGGEVDDDVGMDEDVDVGGSPNNCKANCSPLGSSEYTPFTDTAFLYTQDQLGREYNNKVTWRSFICCNFSRVTKMRVHELSTKFLTFCY